MKVYIIDDDPLSIFVTQSLLSFDSDTWDVHCFLDATVALQQLQAETALPRLIFLDLNMPVMSGWDFLDALSALPALSDKFKVFILTSSLDATDIMRAEAYPIVARFIHKPITSEDIRLIAEEQVPNPGL